ncbi:MAG: hypothetical protein HYS27_20770 [Deltaproteobacteria bacterium]|nr:hypothetical protein [Deltaproteobacteria bacterium]
MPKKRLATFVVGRAGKVMRETREVTDTLQTIVDSWLFERDPARADQWLDELVVEVEAHGIDPFEFAGELPARRRAAFLARYGLGPDPPPPEVLHFVSRLKAEEDPAMAQACVRELATYTLACGVDRDALARGIPVAHRSAYLEECRALT